MGNKLESGKNIKKKIACEEYKTMVHSVIHKTKKLYIYFRFQFQLHFNSEDFIYFK